MEKIALLSINLLAIALFTACSAGGGSGANPTISASVATGNSCTNMKNNQQCSIQLSFNPGNQNHPTLASNIATIFNPGGISSPGITASGQFESSILACQQIINNTPNYTANSCTFEFSWTTQSESSTTAVIFNLAGIYANPIIVSGD